MSRVLSFTELVRYQRPIALLEIDVDRAAESVVVITRDTLLPVAACAIPANGVVKFILPMEYAITGKLLVGILDNNRVYDCKFTDGVRCEIVQSDVDMSQ